MYIGPAQLSIPNLMHTVSPVKEEEEDIILIKVKEITVPTAGSLGIEQAVDVFVK